MKDKLNLNDLAGKVNVPGQGERKLPPLEQWNPPFSGDLDMRIQRDGRWFYLGSEIKRQALVNLFATILLREGDEYFLVTPVEKYRIQVEDAPFVAVLVETLDGAEGPALQFETNVGDKVIAGPQHPIRVEVDAESGEPSPYILVRKNLEALISRNVFYQLVDQAEVKEGTSNELFITSAGEHYSLGRF
ncbi:DUF1285 domain-containing protein [Ketobacter sp.]|uniref:DUF1285 domain-containing protein n=1 Tax=Ketobacter sp. TaxID=2083498 RepID=UPI000F0D6A7E|nr:DUF1285 domain-containing protein [Ketobacter sp.]RLT97908.1 MAG: DUF1285 domain-containing protein [Ketobacter sp.]